MILEGVALELLPAKLVTSHLYMIPHWVLIVLVLVAVFYDTENTHAAVLYGLIFGLVIDIVYTGVLGIYMFTYGICIYLIHSLSRFFHANILSSLLMGILAIMFADASIHLLFSMIEIADMAWGNYFLYRLLPTIVANMLFLLLFYPLLAKRFEIWKDQRLHHSL